MKFTAGSRMNAVHPSQGDDDERMTSMTVKFSQEDNAEAHYGPTTEIMSKMNSLRMENSSLRSQLDTHSSNIPNHRHKIRALFSRPLTAYLLVLLTV